MTYSQDWIKSRRAEIDRKNNLEPFPAADVSTTGWRNFVPYKRG
jgi:hypothetical protein